ncbi:hypothetical protein FBU31_004503, partial [Coemansia sp. 'formosensis']
MDDKITSADYAEHSAAADYGESPQDVGEVVDAPGEGELEGGMDPELAELQKRMLEMEKEAQRLRELEENLTKEPKAGEQAAEEDDVDSR